MARAQQLVVGRSRQTLCNVPTPTPILNSYQMMTARPSRQRLPEASLASRSSRGHPRQWALQLAGQQTRRAGSSRSHLRHRALRFVRVKCVMRYRSYLRGAQHFTHPTAMCAGSSRSHLRHRAPHTPVCTLSSRSHLRQWTPYTPRPAQSSRSHLRHRALSSVPCTIQHVVREDG